MNELLYLMMVKNTDSASSHFKKGVTSAFPMRYVIYF